MKIKSYLLLVFLFFSPHIFSQEARNLTLHECIEIACDSSLQAFISEHYYNSDSSKYAIYKASKLPSLSLKVNPLEYNRNILKRYDYENNLDVYRTQQILQSSGSIALTQDVNLTGGTIFADSEFGYINNRGDIGYSQFSSVPIRLGYSQKLFGFNRLKWEKKIEPLKFEKAKKEFLFRQQEIAENIVNQFFILTRAQKEYDLALENKLTTDSLYNIALEYNKISSISHADLLTLELDKINSVNTFQKARLSLKNAQTSLIDLLNIEDNFIIVIIPEPKEYLSIPIEQAISMTKHNNPNYLLFKQKILEAKRDVDFAKKGLLFDANISASIGFNQVSTKFSEVYIKPLQQDFFSISLTIPIIDWGTRKAKLNIAKNDLNITELNNLIEEKKISQEIISTIDNFKTQQDFLNSALLSINIANQAYKINKERFILGKIDINSLNYSLSRYNETQYNYIEILRMYWASYYKIRKLTLYDFANNIPLSSQIYK